MWLDPRSSRTCAFVVELLARGLDGTNCSHMRCRPLWERALWKKLGFRGTMGGVVRWRETGDGHHGWSLESMKKKISGCWIAWMLQKMREEGVGKRGAGRGREEGGPTDQRLKPRWVDRCIFQAVRKSDD